MAHFYGIVRGARGKASRLGTKNSGLEVQACSWAGAVRVRIFSTEDKDLFVVEHVPWHGQGTSGIIASGIIGEDSYLLKDLGRR